jgi:hypothetical protein
MQKTLPAKKYRALRIFATIQRIIGWFIIVVGSLASIGVAFMILSGSRDFGGFRGEAGAILVALGGILLSLWLGLLQLAFAELFYVGIDIEHNTRQRQ